MISSIIHWSINNRFMVLVLTFMVTGWGIYSVKNTPLDAIPDLSDVQVIIKTSYPGQAPRVVEAHLSAVQESEPGDGKDETIARVDAVLRELREVREQNQGLRRQVYVAWVLAAAAIAAAIALPLVL